MGNSLPPPAPVDLVGSRARLSGANVEILLAAPSLVGSKGVLVLDKGAKTVQGRVRPARGPGGRCLVARVPRRRLGNGIWSLTVRSEGGGDEVVGARLLVQDARPLVLLWGSETPESNLPVRRAMTAKRRAVHTAAHVLDGVLAKLPPDRACRIRGQAESAARRLLK